MGGLKEHKLAISKKRYSSGKTTMPKRTTDYHSWRLEKLADPRIAASYLNAAMDDSPEMFLRAVMNVAQAQQVTRTAKKAGIKRESIYRAFSKRGNPTLDTLHSVLGALGITMEFVAKNAPSKKKPGRHIYNAGVRVANGEAGRERRAKALEH